MARISSCLLVSAGMAGLAAARTLADSGIRVTVVEKARCSLVGRRRNAC